MKTVLKAKMVGGVDDGRDLEIPWETSGDILPVSLRSPVGNNGDMALYELQHANMAKLTALYKYDHIFTPEEKDGDGYDTGIGYTKG